MSNENMPNVDFLFQAYMRSGLDFDDQLEDFFDHYDHYGVTYTPEGKEYFYQSDFYQWVYRTVKDRRGYYLPYSSKAFQTYLSKDFLEHRQFFAVVFAVWVSSLKDEWFQFKESQLCILANRKYTGTTIWDALNWFINYPASETFLKSTPLKASPLQCRGYIGEYTVTSSDGTEKYRCKYSEITLPSDDDWRGLGVTYQRGVLTSVEGSPPLEIEIHPFPPDDLSATLVEYD